MNQDSEDLDDARRTWAADQLGLELSSNRATQAAAICRLVASDQFLPSPGDHDAILAIAHHAGAPRPRPLTSEAADAIYQELRDQIEDFASSFFSIAPAERRRQWEELRQAAAGDVRLMGRLEFLERALSLERPQQIPEDAQGLLIEEIFSTFVFPAVERAARRRSFLLKHRGEMDSVVAAAKSLRRRHAQIARLAPDLIHILLDNPRRLKERRKMVTRRMGVDRKGQTPSDESSMSKVIAIVLFAAIFFGLRLLIDSPGSERPNPPMFPQNHPTPSIEKLIEDAEKRMRDAKSREASKQASGSDEPSTASPEETNVDEDGNVLPDESDLGEPEQDPAP